MTFSPDWLALREPYDAAALAPELLGRLSAWASDRAALRVVDLGAGTGGNMRRLAPRLGRGQRWTLVEVDEALIAAGEATPAPAPAAYRRLDLARDLERLADTGADLLTASALIDLVSAAWLARLVALCHRLGCALHVSLTYDGRVAWDPPDPSDAEVRELVNRHQRIDKGFGPALGPGAAAMLARLLPRPGPELAASDWRLGPADRALQAALLAGHAETAASLDPSAARDVERWRRDRLAAIESGASAVEVGHVDLLFLPVQNPGPPR